MTERNFRHLLSSGSAIAALMLSSLGPALAQPRDLPDGFAIGRNTLGEACDAQRQDSDPSLIDQAFDKSFAISCRSAAASRSVGMIRIVENKAANRDAIEKTLNCGAPSTVPLKGIGNATARLCQDSVLDARVVAISFVRGGRAFYGTGGTAILGALERGLGLASGTDRDSDDLTGVAKASFDPTTLAMAPGMESGDRTGQDFSPRSALSQGVRLNQQGLNVDASRVLNDALSRLSPEDSSQLRGELELEAALADSNIGFFASAESHFEMGQQLLDNTGDALLLRKINTYRALHLLNQRKYDAALNDLLTISRRSGQSSSPLTDSVTLAAINQSGERNSRGLSTVGSGAASAFEQIMLDAQVDWAMSIAYLADGKVEDSRSALARATRGFETIKTGPFERSQTRWLEARIERQRGRIAARQSDWTAAINAFDNSLAALRSIDMRASRGAGPEAAETLFERANILALQGSDRPSVIKAFAEATDALVDARAANGSAPVGMDKYLSVLTDGTRGTTDPANVAMFLRAVQAIGEPGIARQMAELQSSAASDPGVAALVRERTDIAQELSAIRFELSQRQGQPGAPASEQRRDALQSRLQTIDDSLASNGRFRATDDRPVTLDDMQKVIGDGEVYFKLTTLRNRAYGLMIGKNESFAYEVPSKLANLDRDSRALRFSITKGKLAEFKLGIARSMFKAIGGAGGDRLLAASRIVIDPSGPLDSLPISVLITDDDSIRSHMATKRENPRDYSGIAFLGKRAEISTALSPRSFLVTRALPSSSARQPFIGFAQHAIPTLAELDSFKPVMQRSGCTIDRQAIEYSYPNLKPIGPEELYTASAELGVANAPIMSGTAFSDTAVLNRTDLNQFSILHFATHGLTEGLWGGCVKAPPALVTSLGSGGSDGILSFDEIATLKLDANLVFLSACDTATGINSEELVRSTGGEELGSSLEGLVRAFLSANARAVVATYWEASDSPSTQLLVRTFYANGRSSSISAALRQAQMAVISNPVYSHPFFWAPFFVVGDGGKAMLAQRSAGTESRKSEGAGI
jgi:CHAT domain-containing protein/tetratricopeptide (TPR) repeat protein